MNLEGRREKKNEGGNSPEETPSAAHTQPHPAGRQQRRGRGRFVSDHIPNTHTSEAGRAPRLKGLPLDLRSQGGDIPRSPKGSSEDV